LSQCAGGAVEQPVASAPSSVEPAPLSASAPAVQEAELRRAASTATSTAIRTRSSTSTLQRPKRVADLQIDVVIQKLALLPDADVGDLGCGPGLFAVAFAKACPQGVVFAYDIEPAQLDAVRAKIHAEKLGNVVPVLASEDDPHFPPGPLDVVFIGDTYHHLDDRVAYARRLMRVLRAGGRLVILDYKPGKLAVGPPPEHKLRRA
jgi:SAM-dependent methyltransferase